MKQFLKSTVTFLKLTFLTILLASCHSTEYVKEYLKIEPPAETLVETTKPVCKKAKVKDVFECVNLYDVQLKEANTKVRVLRKWNDAIQ